MSTKSKPQIEEELRSRYQTALHKFTASSNSFEVIDTLELGQTTEAAKASSPPLTAIYVLDSSFNPPSVAHLHIARTALLASLSLSSSSTTTSTGQHNLSSVKLLLLLATQNADKPAKPALFEDRLVMMNLFGRDLLEAFRSSASNDVGASDTDNGGSSIHLSPSIDIGLTSRPYFIDKAASISQSGTYSPADAQQIHLTGYDTLIRIFEPKYYPPSHTLGALAPFLSKHRLRVTMRPDDSWGGVEEQRAFLEGLRGGYLAAVGGKREWAERIEMVEGFVGQEQEAVSSTRARSMATVGDAEKLGTIVTHSVRDYILQRRLYTEERETLNVSETRVEQF